MRNYLLLLAGQAALLPTGAAWAWAMSFGPATAYATIAIGSWATYWLEMAGVNANGQPDVVTIGNSNVLGLANAQPSRVAAAPMAAPTC